MLQGRTIIIGVTGGIAAYKSCEVVSRLKKLGAEVWVIMTKEAAELVGPLTFRTLSGNPVVMDLFSKELSSIPLPHISLAQKADLILIAPCTANMIGKIAHGIADDALSTTVLASSAQKIIAPAMNTAMWNNPIVRENVRKLKDLGFSVIGPEEGKLACGEEDIGCMSEPGKIIEELVSALMPLSDLKGKHILVTAGGTREAIDPVRFIANRSSGKMGYALARAARERGAEVTLISANVNLPAPLDIKPIKVESAGGMLETVFGYYSSADIIIMAAAVADFTPKNKSQKSKVKKNGEAINLELNPSEDILKKLSQQKGRRGRILVGFALETENLIANAREKMRKKDLDLIIANAPSTFERDEIQFTIIDRKGGAERYQPQTKNQAAHKILDKIIPLIA
jgi:phosphopantothenoylcysteine decarboxylase/phosphopantothenate--cysteine ligase